MDYISKYKCKYCGQIFNGAITGNEAIAFSAIVRACAGIELKYTNDIFDKTPHIKPDHYGIGELIGMEIVGGES